MAEQVDPVPPEEQQAALRLGHEPTALAACTNRAWTYATTISIYPTSSAE